MSHPQSEPPAPHGAPIGASVFLRALFLACSWTWCIGMFLPVLLMRDFGWPGWVAFAVPNVVGAAAVGFVFARPGAAARAAALHATAMRAFSAVTVVFHVAFLAWLLPLVFEGLMAPVGEITVSGITVVPASIGEGIASAGAVALIVVVALMASGARTTAWMLGAVTVYAISIAMALLAAANGDPYATSPPTGDEPFPAIAGAAAVLALGFLACPHMDLTILRTRHELTGPKGTRAFLLGFGVFFLGMIALTLAYAPRFLTHWTSQYIAVHIIVQAAFTISAHLRELRTGSIERETPRGFPPMLALTLALSLIALTGAWLAYTGSGQFMYELFLAPYALVFPAYVWIVMVPHRRLTRSAPWETTRRARLVCFAIAVAAASPVLWHAAIGEPKRWIWAALGMAIVVVAPITLNWVPWQRAALPRE